MQILATLGFPLVVFTRDLKDYGFCKNYVKLTILGSKKPVLFYAKKTT